jgi:hypothetical protein
MSNTLTRLALNTEEERATAEIRADGPVARRGTLCVSVKLASTASSPVPIGATTSATRRAITVIRTAKAVLPLVNPIGMWVIALDPTQREFIIRDRGQRSWVPIAGHPLYPWRGQTNITGPSRSVHVDRCCYAIDAEIGWEESVVVIQEIHIHLQLECSNHIGILQKLDVPQENICLRTSTEEHVVL